MSNDSPKVIIKEINKQDYPKTNPYFGIKYEEILKKRTIRHLEGVNSIYDPGVFSQEGRYIQGIKAFVVKGKNKKEVFDSYKFAFSNDNFYIFPYFCHKFIFSVDNIEYTLTIDNDGYVGVNADYFYTEGQTVFFNYNGQKYYFSEFKSNRDELLQIYLVNNCFMILFLTKIEIDGFFNVQKEFEISSFQGEEVCFLNKSLQKIPKESFLVYEIKSGEKINDLLSQLLYHYAFLNKFFEVFTKYNFKKFVFFCFFRSKEKIKIEDECLLEKINKIELPVILIRYADKVFNESIYYENVKINEIGEIKSSIDNLKTRIDNFDDSLRKELNEIKEMLRSQINNSSQVPLNFVNYPFGYFIPFGQFSQNNNHSQNI